MQPYGARSSLNLLTVPIRHVSVSPSLIFFVVCHKICFFFSFIFYVGVFFWPQWILAKGSIVVRINEKVGNTVTDRGNTLYLFYFCILPEAESSGVAQMLLPDLDQTVTSALCLTFCWTFTHAHAHTHSHLLSGERVCIAQEIALLCFWYVPTVK